MLPCAAWVLQATCISLQAAEGALVTALVFVLIQAASVVVDVPVVRPLPPPAPPPPARYPGRLWDLDPIAGFRWYVLCPGARAAWPLQQHPRDPRAVAGVSSWRPLSLPPLPPVPPCSSGPRQCRPPAGPAHAASVQYPKPQRAAKLASLCFAACHLPCLRAPLPCCARPRPAGRGWPARCRYDTRVKTILSNITFMNYVYQPELGAQRQSVWFTMVHRCVWALACLVLSCAEGLGLCA